MLQLRRRSAVSRPSTNRRKVPWPSSNGRSVSPRPWASAPWRSLSPSP